MLMPEACNFIKKEGRTISLLQTKSKKGKILRVLLTENFFKKILLKY